MTTVAAIGRDGRRSPVVFGDSLTLPTPAFDDDSLGDLLRAVEAVRGDDGSVVTALAEHLRTVADHAGPCDAVTIVVPPSWGRRHHDRVTRAASAAALPPPQILSEAAAVAAHSLPDAAEDQTVLVCVLGRRTSHATVVQRHEHSWIRVATQAIPDATGDRIDQALATAVGAQAAAAQDLLAQIADARPRLAAGQPTAIVVAGQLAPVTIGPADFATVAQTARNAAVAAVLDTLDAAAVDAHQLHSAVVAGDLAGTLALADELSAQLAKPATAVADGRLAAAYGALATRASSSPPTERGTLWRRWGFRVVYLLAPAVAVLAAALLQWQIFDTVSFILGPEIGRLPSDYQKLTVAFDTAAFACVGWCLTAASLGLARIFAAAARADAAEAGQDRDREAGQIYAFGAVAGLALASMQGLLAQAIVGGPTELAPPYLAASLAGAVIPALIAIVIGLTSRWLTARPSWTDRVHHPIGAVILAAVGVLAANARSTGLSLAGLPHVVTAALGFVGSGLLGVGIAFTLVTMRAARFILGAIVGVACMAVVETSNLHSAIVIYLIAVGLWWIRRGSRIMVDNLPPQWWRRFALADDSGDTSP